MKSRLTDKKANVIFAVNHYAFQLGLKYQHGCCWPLAEKQDDQKKREKSLKTHIDFTSGSLLITMFNWHGIMKACRHWQWTKNEKLEIGNECDFENTLWILEHLNYLAGNVRYLYGGNWN